MSSTARSTDRRRIVPAVLVLALAAATIALGLTGALFTDSDTIADNSFDTGEVTLGTSPTELLFTATDMAPGDTEGPYDVTVSNDGSLEYRYAITSTAANNSDNLAEQFDLWIWDEADEESGTADTCDATPGNGVTTYLYEQGDLATGTDPTNLVGDPANGEQTGDRVLAVSDADEVLCFYVELPVDAGNDLEGQSVEVDFGFEAEQTANNP